MVEAAIKLAIEELEKQNDEKRQQLNQSIYSDDFLDIATDKDK
jgi:hypothetical protein